MLHQTLSNPLDLLNQALAEKRQIMIYGAGSQGRGLLRALRENGFDAVGFIDRNPDLTGKLISGLPVSDLSVLEQDGAENNLLVLVAAFFFEREIAAYLDNLNFKKNQGYVLYSTLKPRDYVVEVVDVCNLRCISCPRADRDPGVRSNKMMSLETFKQVIAKLRREEPFVGNIQLYQWGEPTLNKQLPDMIRHARENGILCSLSSNLNHKADFRALIESRPECIRLSASGTEANYEITHTGGKWRSFIENVETVGRLRQEIYPEMKVELYYHRYKHSLGEQQTFIADLCKRLDFEFHPVPAYIISLDDVLAYCEGTDLPATAQEARTHLVLDLDEGLQHARKEAHLECDALRVIQVNADLSMSACMMYYNAAENTITDNYLEHSLAEIIEKRNQVLFCGRCKAHGIHRYCASYAKLSEQIRY